MKLPRHVIFALSSLLAFVLLWYVAPAYFADDARAPEQHLSMYVDATKVNKNVTFDPVFSNTAAYETYLKHQKNKLDKHFKTIVKFDIRADYYVERYLKYLRERGILHLNGSRVLCLGARLGGEVRAFKAMGSLAVGIDLNPGPNNLHVLPGDFHRLQFPDDSFDILYSNVVDHVLFLDTFFEECNRVLRKKGLFLVMSSRSNEGAYEVRESNISLAQWKALANKHGFHVKMHQVQRLQDWGEFNSLVFIKTG